MSSDSYVPAIALFGLAPCLLWFVLAVDDRLLVPLTGVLAGAALLSNLLEVRLEGALWVSPAFVCCLMGSVFLGPPGGFLIPLVGEVGAWSFVRFRWVSLAVNSLGAIVPTMLAAAMLTLLPSRTALGDLGYDLSLATVAATALILNIMIVAPLTALYEKQPAAKHLVVYRNLVPLLATNIGLLVLLVEAYRRIGLAASAFLMAVILAFAYVVRLLVLAREHTRQIEDLSSNRGRLVAQALNAEERERRILAERLHDEIVQNLLAASQDLEEARDGQRIGLRRAERAIHKTVDELREAIFDLHPAVLDQAGLPAALNAMCKQQQERGKFRLALTIDERAAGAHDALLYSLAREFLTNVVKHARATHVAVTLRRCDETIELTVEDDGVAFPETRKAEALRRGHIGLASSEERVKAVQGRFELTAQLGSGTRIQITLPVPRS